MKLNRQCDWVQDLFFPTLLFMALGGMTWAVRGCSGFGAAAGCIFAGVMWGAAWWYLAHEPKGEQTRRYSSAWIVLAVTLAFGYSGARGWMQWPSFFEGRLDTNVRERESVPISPLYGFLWLFIAGVPWAGLGACALAWCGSLRETRAWQWALRIGLGMGCAYLARYLYDTYPAYFLPLYTELESQYKDREANPNLQRLINDSGAAIFHLGFYLGFLLFEFLRRDWKNVTLILTVGILNGAGWAACQNWKWANRIWSPGDFNFWRCWESCGGLSIGLAYGIAYFLVNRRMSAKERAFVATQPALAGPNFEWWLVFSGLAAFLSPFLRGVTQSWSNDYLAVLFVWATAYYLIFRSAPKKGSATAGVAGWMAALLSLAFILGVYLPALARTRLNETDLLKIVPNEMAAHFLSRTIHYLQYLVPYRPYYSFVVTAIGLAWLLIFRSRFAAEKAANTPRDGDVSINRMGLFLGLLAGLGLSIRNGAKGWFNIHEGNERYWSELLWKYLGPTFLVMLILATAWSIYRRLRYSNPRVRFPHAYSVIWLVLIVQNVIAQAVTGPWSKWREVAFSIYYVLLFFVTAVIVIHFHFVKTNCAPVAATENINEEIPFIAE